MTDPKDSLKAFQECFQIAARGALGNKVAQSKQVIRQGRAVIQTQFEIVREEMRSFRSTVCQLLELGGDTREKKEWAKAFLTQLATELLQELLKDWAWTWESRYLQLAASNASVQPRPRPEPPLLILDTRAPSLPSADGPALNSYAAQLLKEYVRSALSFFFFYPNHVHQVYATNTNGPLIPNNLQGNKKLQEIISYRPAVALKDGGYVFEWPPGSGLYCVTYCVRCGFSSNTNPLNINHVLAAQVHWSMVHPEWKGADSFLLYTVIMTVFVLRVEGTTLEEIQLHNSDITKMTELKNRRDKARRQAALLAPPHAPSAPINANPVEKLKRSHSGTLKETTMSQGGSMAQPIDLTLTLPRLKSQPSTVVQAQVVRDPGDDGDTSSDDEPLMGKKRLRYLIEVDIAKTK
ncbi:hypothetical protein PG996_016041 [Apiospora saccharicola]|uniref:Uncharacterized protein n=1 Tax=Apiospora saccharicola TaxID=335842 RepID=A0ABR1TNF7_9PEZI